MRKISVTIILATIFYSSFSQSYKEQLKKVNDFLKTFDNGYYGYLEIKDGYLYDRFPSGKYSKSEIKYLGKAYESDPGKKVSINCIDGKDCVFSTYTDSYHESIGFSQTYSFNTSQLINLLDNLITAYKKTNGTNTDNDDDIDYNAEKRRLEGLKSNIDITSNSSVNKSNTSGNYQSALKKLNDYLKTFDNGYYGYYEVKDGYIYERFKAGKYNKFKMEDMEGAVIQEQYNRVIFKCKGDNKCISTDWKTNGQEEYTQFVTTGKYNYQELADLLNNFRDAYLGKSITTTTTNTDKSRDIDAINRQKAAKKNNTSNNNDDDYDEDWDALEAIAAKTQKQIKEAKTTSTNGNAYQVPLQKLNEYLKTFNAETYRVIEVKNGKVYFAFFVYGTIYKSSIDISELKNNTIITIGKSVGSFKTDQVKISCKSESKCFYSTYSNGNTDHFRFFSHSVNDFTKMEQLVNDFIKAL
jgi:hypothetical protein